MQELHINVKADGRHKRKKQRSQRGFMDKALLPVHVYCA